MNVRIDESGCDEFTRDVNLLGDSRQWRCRRGSDVGQTVTGDNQCAILYRLASCTVDKRGADIGIGIVPASTSNIDSLAIALGMEIGAMGMGK